MKSTPLSAKLLITAALCTLAPAAMANPDRMLKKLDTDEDGQISMLEFEARERSMVNRLDSNGDNAVTQDEIAAHLTEHKTRMQDRMAEVEQRLAQRFRAADLNADGSVTAEEASASMFSKIDANADGYLSIEEIKEARPEGRRGGRFGGPGQGRHYGKLQPSDEV